MRCTVYRSRRLDYTYVYLSGKHEWDELPEALRARFGEPVEVLSLDLEATKQLARVDIRTVRRELASEGYYVQMPPRHSLDEEIADALDNRGRGRFIKRD